MEELLGSALLIIIGLCLGAVIGTKGSYEAITKNCEKIGGFRDNDKVYECKLKTQEAK